VARTLLSAKLCRARSVEQDKSESKNNINGSGQECPLYTG